MGILCFDPSQTKTEIPFNGLVDPIHMLEKVSVACLNLHSIGCDSA
jgi:hypothetical protein